MKPAHLKAMQEAMPKRPSGLVASFCARLAGPCLMPFFALLVTLAAALAPATTAGASGTAALLLDEGSGTHDAWPAVTILKDPGGALSATQALAAAGQFEKPQSAYATLGVNSGTVVWLRIPVVVPAEGNGEWTLHIDYSQLNRIDVFAATDGVLHSHTVTGNLQPASAVAGGSRTPAAPLRLKPGGAHVVLLRIENFGAMILPIHFSKASAYQATALAEQMLQGMLVGLSLCLLLYSLAQWINLREQLFGKYALLIAGTTLFSVEFFGLGGQYLWRGNAWMTLHAGGLFALMASCGGYLFVEQALARPGKDRIFSLLMRTGAALAALFAAAYGLDIISVEALVVIVSTLGLLPMLLGLPGAFRRARSGDVVGTYFLVGWAVSFLSSVILSQVIGGKLAANFWTMHALQFGNAFDMLVFMRILGLRTKAMQDAMLRAEEATRLKSDFLANMSHEIRTPMNAILGMSRLALTAAPTPQQRHYLAKILGAGEHLLRIIDDILDFSKIEAGKLTLEKLPFRLEEMLEQLSTLCAVKTDPRQVALVTRVEPGVPTTLLGDPLRLGQVLLNLTGNAVKFTERGEIVVTVKTFAREGDSVELEFSVRDTGIGMSEEQLSLLFQSFSQADSSITRKYGGTGLGLSISRQLVELMGGTIHATSTPGVGSCFIFSVKLDVADAAAANLAARAADASLPKAELARLNGARILLAEDNANNREVAIAFLQAARVQVDVAVHGGEAVRMVQQGDYDLVLMDVQMHEVDGLTAARRIRAIDSLRALPIIAMTAHAMPEDEARSLDAGMNGHVTKPIDPDVMFRALLKWIDPVRLAGRTLHAAPDADLPAASAPAIPAYPPLAGVDWQYALARADGNPAILAQRMRTFCNEYKEGPAVLAAALAGGGWAMAECLAHNLKSSATYLGAAGLARLADLVEAAVRAGRPERCQREAMAMAQSLDIILAGFADALQAPIAAIDNEGADFGRLLRALDGHLRADDARSEDLLTELSVLLAGSSHAALLARIQRAVDEIEYHEALKPLADLARALNVDIEQSA